MAVWLVCAGGKGEQEDYALENSLAVIGWQETAPTILGGRFVKRLNC